MPTDQVTGLYESEDLPVLFAFDCIEVLRVGRKLATFTGLNATLAAARTDLLYTF